MESIKIVDGFIFAIIDKETAKEKFENNEIIYQLYDDDTEAQILFEEEFESNYIVFGASIGFVKDFENEFENESQNRFRNKDERSFNQWLDDKINLILE